MTSGCRPPGSCVAKVPLDGAWAGWVRPHANGRGLYRSRPRAGRTYPVLETQCPVQPRVAAGRDLVQSPLSAFPSPRCCSGWAATPLGLSLRCAPLCTWKPPGELWGGVPIQSGETCCIACFPWDWELAPKEGGARATNTRTWQLVTQLKKVTIQSGLQFVILPQHLEG